MGSAAVIVVSGRISDFKFSHGVWAAAFNAAARNRINKQQRISKSSKWFLMIPSLAKITVDSTDQLYRIGGIFSGIITPFGVLGKCH
jgi:hypothetical protein